MQNRFRVFSFLLPQKAAASIRLKLIRFSVTYPNQATTVTVDTRSFPQPPLSLLLLPSMPKELKLGLDLPSYSSLSVFSPFFSSLLSCSSCQYAIFPNGSKYNILPYQRFMAVKHEPYFFLLFPLLKAFMPAP